jgi:hypothetical protein
MDYRDYSFEITRLASLNKTPKQIEKILGLDDYTIHKRYHTYLMMGYRQYFETHEWEENITWRRMAFMGRLKRRLNSVIKGKNEQVFTS